MASSNFFIWSLMHFYTSLLLATSRRRWDQRSLLLGEDALDTLLNNPRGIRAWSVERSAGLGGELVLREVVEKYADI